MQPKRIKDKATQQNQDDLQKEYAMTAFRDSPERDLDVVSLNEDISFYYSPLSDMKCSPSALSKDVYSASMSHTS